MRLALPLALPPLLALALAPEQASAHGVDLLHLRPAVGDEVLYAVEAAPTLAPGRYTGSLAVVYTDAPFRWTSSEGEGVGVDFQAASFVGFKVGLPWRLELGADLPVVGAQEGTSISAALDVSLQSKGLGDLRLSPRWRLTRDDSSMAFLTVAAPLTLPTGLESAYLGEHGPTWSPQVQGAGDRGRLSWAGLLGYRLRPPVNLYYFPFDASLTLGNEWIFGGRLGVRLVDSLSVAGEVEGRFGSQKGHLDDPAELRIGALWRSSIGLYASLGAATGLTEGYGSGDLRAFVRLGWGDSEATKPRRDPDGDGITAHEDRCPDDAEDLDGHLDEDGCPDPDNDADGVVDAEDKCPIAPETPNGFEDSDGCPDTIPDQDGDGQPDDQDRCPEEAEDRDGDSDADGCPEPDPTPVAPLPDPDLDRDDIPNERDLCPEAAETRNGFKDDDGCPEPDTDGDEIIDGLDACPKKPETRNGFRDDDGCPEADMDGDQIIDGFDACPKKPETRNGLRDDDGCPEPDTDGDQIIDGLDACPKKRETYNGLKDADGCPEPLSPEDAH